MELLSIVEILKKFHMIILGQRINIYKHDNHLMWKDFDTDRILRWIPILEEYGPDIEYILGDKNIAAYTLSLLPNNGNQ